MNLVARAKADLQRAMAQMGEPVVLSWRTVTGGTVDPTTGSVLGGTAVEGSATVNCFVYALEEGGKAKLERFQGIPQCDYLVDAPPDITIEGREELYFTVRGVRCAQADLGQLGGTKPLKQVEMAQGVALYRTLYLKRI